MLSFASVASAEVTTISVPLDHAAPGGPQTQVAYDRRPARGERRGTIVFLSGGPGEPAIRFADDLASGPLRALRQQFDLVFVDQRGTGRSAPLRCATAPNGRFSTDLSAERLQAAIAACATELGSERRHYSTMATALDVEAVREAIGMERIIPLGVSYGAQVAAEYARRFPDRLQALVLDSASPVEGLDTMSLAPQTALARVFREACFPPGCSDLLGEPVTLIAESADRLRRRPLAGLGAEDVHALVLASDTDPLLRTDIPATLQAAIGRDAGPLRRLARYAGGGSGRTQLNEVRFLATACVEGNQPWDPDTDPAGREAALEGYLRANRAAYAPFPIEAVAPNLTATQCLSWPATPRAPLPPAFDQGSGVPTLVLAGREDLRTPLESQRGIAAQFPGATVRAVADVGHSVLVNEATDCARDSLRAFLLFLDVTPRCDRRVETDIALPYFDALREVPRARGRLSERVERTATAVNLTMVDALRWGPVGPMRGVRGGRVRLGDETLVLRRYELVPGVVVSGTWHVERGGRVTVTGRGATGVLRVRPSLRMTGRLDGETVRYQPLG
ncbi:MAG TPA: alpha/beta fold hydrolase [Solirubrobacteraceae bacterium]